METLFSPFFSGCAGASRGGLVGALFRSFPTSISLGVSVVAVEVVSPPLWFLKETKASFASQAFLPVVNLESLWSFKF